MRTAILAALLLCTGCKTTYFTGDDESGGVKIVEVKF